MRIVLDLQAAQCHGRLSDIGRYSLAFAKAIARVSEEHTIFLALSGRFPNEACYLMTEFTTLLPKENIRVFELPGPLANADPANAWRSKTAELLRENFLADLQPDIVYLSAVFEGWHNDAVASIGQFASASRTAVSLFDPGLLDSAQFEAAAEQFHRRQSRLLSDADLLFTVSRLAREKAIAALHLTPDRVINIPPSLEAGVSKGTPELQHQLLAESNLRGPFILYAWGDEERDNLEYSIAAFALLPTDLRKSHKLAFAGEIAREERAKILSFCRDKGLAESQVVTVNSGAATRALYGLAELIVFPSRREEVGMSLLDAWIGGGPVIASNSGIHREMINPESSLFEPTDPQNLAARIADFLLNPDLRRNAQQSAAEHLPGFSWDEHARKALAAFEEICKSPAKNRATRSTGKPLLALVAPFPPERTGIAGYSARLAPGLAEYYDVVCVTDQPRISDSLLSTRFPVRDVRWFERNGGRFERVLYQFGNSPSHKQMFSLLEQHTGVVVLHDFFLSDVLCWMADSGYKPGCFSKALYDSHGLSALVVDSREGKRKSVETFPCNLAVLRESAGVIVHSSHAIDLARSRYGDAACARMRRVPFLPRKPNKCDPAAARERLNLPKDGFVVCSFGWVTPFKLCERILKSWSISPLGKAEDCFLIFVGAADSGNYGKEFTSKVAASESGSRVRITGYIDEQQYHDYLAAADLAVQLRTQSRGETSATVFDCIAHDLPLVVNAHGSATELPDDAVIKLDDDFTDQALANALNSLRTDPELRRKYSVQAAAYLNDEHRPELIAKLYHDFIEEVYNLGPRAREQKLLQKIARTLTPVTPSSDDLASVAKALSANREPFGPPQILVDITNISKLDLRTGIERVTRGILMSLITRPPAGYRIEAVRAHTNGYVYARRFMAESLHFAKNELGDDPVETKRGDIFLGVDWPADVLPSLKPWFRAQTRHGMRSVFVVYDLLPLLRPDLFPPELPPMTLGWLNTVTEISDAAVCISRTVADELHTWLGQTMPNRSNPLPIGFFHLGADLRASLPTKGLPDEALAILAKLRCRKTFLMIGTVEPRKGHRQALAAMELLWSRGVDVNLVIIGKQGWMMDDFAKRVQEHPEREKRLFWHQGISDQMLEEIYRNASALLAASEGEGFGLPLIEAAKYDIPIIARDIPIFREVASDHAYYFSGRDEAGLANAIQEWLASGSAVPTSRGIGHYTWEESSRELLDLVIGERWYRLWQPSNPYNAAISTFEIRNPD
jgi:glycosyltransferase involved in cell wall biosynthesis